MATTAQGPRSKRCKCISPDLEPRQKIVGGFVMVQNQCRKCLGHAGFHLPRQEFNLAETPKWKWPAVTMGLF